MLRFAPSPTGDMHIGNLRAAIFNYIMAKKLKQPFIIRIEDTDLERNIAGKDKEILSLLQTFGLEFSSVIYQSDNFPLHRDMALKLIKENKAFYCYCSKEFLEEKREEARVQKIAFRYKDEWAELEKGQKSTSPIIRLRANEAVSFVDSIKGEISFNSNEIDSFVIMRNEIPTYNFACSIDDKEMSYIIRGEDHISNTPKQILIKRALGFGENVRYAHLPIILNEEHKKMSKRDKASSVQWLLSQGLEARAIANYLILLGNTKLESQIGERFSLESCIEHFCLEKVASNPAQFDYKKIVQISRDIMREKDITSFYPLFTHLESMRLESPQSFDGLIALYINEVSTQIALREHIDSVFLPIENKRELLLEFHNEFDNIVSILQDNIDKVLSYDYNELKDFIIEQSGYKGKSLFKPLRMILSGQEHGVELDKLYQVVKPFISYIVRK
ncbi:glutamate--tRNA ligase [Helicobacter trogontum]|uniref:glutamate--tRNA ligase n=1 Tax=Helicobacter trogontum TaxID=50960 RepID=UPI000CF0A5CD|nr:glutamate--tRNA ligase [Helicobacter trogontum]